MRIGVQLFASCRDNRQPAEALRSTVQLAVMADELGYDSVWFAEHHLTPWNSCTDPLTLAAHVAGVTARIKLGTAVVNVTLHHPRAVAERAQLVQAVSGNRLLLGIGRGFSTSDYAAFGVDPEQATAIFAENHTRLRAALAEAAQPPPAWLATTGAPPTLVTAAECRYGLLLAASGTKLIACVDAFRQQWRQRHSDQPRIAVFRAVHVADDVDQARDEITRHVGWYVEQMARLQPGLAPPSTAEVMDTFCILGSPTDCIDAISALNAETGLSDLICVFGIGGAPRDLTIAAMRRFSQEVASAITALT